MLNKILMGIGAAGLMAGLYLSVNKERWPGPESEAKETLALIIDQDDAGAVDRMITAQPALAEASLGLATPLVQAIMGDHPGTVKLLLEHGADPNRKVFHGWTAMHFAAKSGDPLIVSALLQYGGRVNALTDTDENPLMAAACTSLQGRQALGERRIVELLLAAGADVDAKNQRGETALMIAVQNENLLVVRALVRGRANVLVRNGDGSPAGGS